MKPPHLSMMFFFSCRSPHGERGLKLLIKQCEYGKQPVAPPTGSVD